MFLLNDPDRSTVARQDFFEPDLSVNPLSAAVRGVVSGLSLAPTVAQFALGDDEPLFEEMPSLVSMASRGLKGEIRSLVDTAAENATLYRARQEDAMMQSGMASNLAYGLSYYLSGFVGGGLNPASYGLGLGKARMETEIRAGVDEDTAFTIGAIEGVTAGFGATIPFLGKTAVQRFGFGVAANVIPGIAQRKAEQVTYGEVYAERAPEVFDPVALAVDSVLGGGFAYLSGLGAKPETIPADAINDALDANINVRSGDAAPGFPNPKAFGIHMRMVKETIDAQAEGRAPDYTPLLDAEFADSPEMIRNFEESLADVTAGRMTDDRPIYDDILPQIEATGVYSAPEARANAKLASMAYTAMAKRMGMNPRDLMDQMPLKVIIDAVEGFGQPQGLIRPPSTLTMPDVPSPEQMVKLSRVENVPLSNVVSFQSARRDTPRVAGDESFDLVKGYGDKPVAVRLNNGEYVIYDGNHRTDAAIERGDEALEMYVIDARSYDPQNAGRTPAPVDDDALLAELLGQNPSLRQSMQYPKDLFVGHNLSAENLRAVLELGGLAAPSLGISRTTTGGFGGYGDITLLADKSILETKGARTFNADVYSPRQPRAISKVDEKSFNELLKELDDIPAALSRPDMDEVARYGADALARSDAVRYSYLKSKGQAPKIKPRKVDTEIKQAAKLGINSWYALRSEPKFIAIAKKYYERTLKEIGESAPDLVDKMRVRYFDPDGSVKGAYVEQLAQKTTNYLGDGGLDVGQLRQDIAKKFRTDKANAELSDYARNMASKVVTGKLLELSPKRKVPYTLDAVVAQMTKDLRGGEGFNYGAGNIRAQFAAEIKSVQGVQARRNEIVSGEDFKRLKEESNDRLMKTMDELAPFYKYDANGWGYMNDATAAIAEGPKGWREAFRITSESEAIIRGYIDYVSTLPTEYFETKMQRAVGLSEFKEAIVPKKTPADIVSALKEAGLKVRTYDGNSPTGRIDAIAKAKDLLFQEARGTYSPDTNTIGLTRAADSSTFVHELGHHLFEMLGKLASDPNAPTQIRADFETLVKHGGMKVDDWYASDINTRRAAHEKIADDFETYLMTGEAPSLELRNLFGMIRDWMLGVYKTIRGEVQPEVRAVFDRMLATDEQMAMKAQVVDYLAVQRQTEAKAKSSLDDNLIAAERAINPDIEVVIDGTRIKASELLKAEEPQEATAMQKLKECLLNV